MKSNEFLLYKEAVSSFDLGVYMMLGGAGTMAGSAIGEGYGAYKYLKHRKSKNKESKKEREKAKKIMLASLLAGAAGAGTGIYGVKKMVKGIFNNSGKKAGSGAVKATTGVLDGLGTIGSLAI